MEQGGTVTEGSIGLTGGGFGMGFRGLNDLIPEQSREFWTGINELCVNPIIGTT